MYRTDVVPIVSNKKNEHIKNTFQQTCNSNEMQPI